MSTPTHTVVRRDEILSRVRLAMSKHGLQSRTLADEIADAVLASLPEQGEQQSDEQIIRAAVAAMPHTNPGVADDLIQGFTMHTEAEDIVAIWRAASGASQTPRAWEGPAGQLIPHEFYVPMAAAYPDKAVGYVPLYRATSKEQP